MNKQEIEKAIDIVNIIQKFHDFECSLNKEFGECYPTIISALTQQLNNGWIPVSERLPETYREVDGDSVYYVSNNVLCSAYNKDTSEYEAWIDYTIDGEWQTHEYYEDEILAWRPLPEPYKEVLDGR